MGCNSSKNVHTSDSTIHSINELINKHEKIKQKYKLIDLGYGYSKNSIHVYYYGHVLENALSSSFVVDDDFHAHDMFSNYFKGKEL